jgi:acyl-CoA reductase-like NAD-dependent aldehyde dehydrogenase
MAIHPLLEDRGFTPFHAAQMAEKARWAAEAFSTYERADVLKIAEAVASAAQKSARRFAEMAVRETGYGIADHKALKNEACSKGVLARYRAEDFTGVRLVPEAKTVEIAKPVGVVFATLPATSPIAALYCAAIMCLLTRNTVIFSPHPAAKQATVDAARYLAKAAEDAGAPDGTIQVIDAPSQMISDTLAKSAGVTIALDSDGNVPVYVDESAHVARAARAIADSKAFDNGIGFANESAIIAHAAIADRLREELAQNGCHVCSEAERGKLETLLFPLAKFDTNWTGKSAVAIAAKAGIKVPARTRVLVVPLERVGDDYPLSREKPCPVLGFYGAASRDSAMSACRAMLRGVGGGACAAVHAEDAAMFLRFGAEMNVGQIFVNAGSAPYASGFPTHLAPFDITPDRLVRHVAMAWSKDPAVKLPSFAGVKLPRPASIGRPPQGEIDYDFGNPPPPVQARKAAGKSRIKTRA